MPNDGLKKHRQSKVKFGGQTAFAGNDKETFTDQIQAKDASNNTCFITCF